MRITAREDAVEARSTIIDAGETPFALRCHWRLDGDWRSRLLRIEREDGHSLTIERREHGWRIDGEERPELADCLEIDVSATPFCNGLALRGLKHQPSELTALYVDAADLSVQPSRQRYDFVGPQRWRYVDLGVADGFRALLDFDTDGLVMRYEGLFERV